MTNQKWTRDSQIRSNTSSPKRCLVRVELQMLKMLHKASKKSILMMVGQRQSTLKLTKTKKLLKWMLKWFLKSEVSQSQARKRMKKLRTWKK